MSWWVAGIGAAVAVIGTTVSYFGQQQQSQNASAIANYNAQIAEQNRQVNLAIAQQQAQWQQQNAEAQAQAANNNATALEQQGRAAEAQAREQARRQREQNDRQLAMQRARYGKSGVTSEGSPLAVMSETASLLELGVQGIHYQGDLQGREYDAKAAQERSSAAYSMFDSHIAEYEGAASAAGFQIQSSKDKADYLSGMALSKGYQNQSYGSLISGAGSAIGDFGTAYDRQQNRQALQKGR